MCGPRLSKPSVGMPSGRLMGHTHANRVDMDRAKAAAPIRTGAGRELQNQFSPARAENRVRKSDTATFKKMEVVIWP